MNCIVTNLRNRYVPITQDIQRALYGLTGGHTGLIRTCLNCIVNHFCDFSTPEKPTPEKSILEYLASDDLFNFILCTRAAFFTRKKFSSWQVSLLRRVIKENGILEPFHNDQEFAYLVVAGVLGMTKDHTYDFPSRLIQTIVCEYMEVQPTVHTNVLSG